MSVVKQIEVKETLIKTSLQKIDELEIKLRKSKLSDDERDIAKGELLKMRKDLSSLEKDLKGLRNENFQNMIITVSALVFCLLVYYLLKMLWTK